MLTSLKFGFYLNVIFSALNLASFMSTGSVFALLIGAFNGYVAWSLRRYA